MSLLLFSLCGTFPYLNAFELELNRELLKIALIKYLGKYADLHILFSSIFEEVDK